MRLSLPPPLVDDGVLDPMRRRALLRTVHADPRLHTKPGLLPHVRSVRDHRIFLELAVERPVATHRALLRDVLLRQLRPERDDLPPALRYVLGGVPFDVERDKRRGGQVRGARRGEHLRAGGGYFRRELRHGVLRMREPRGFDPDEGLPWRQIDMIT